MKIKIKFGAHVSIAGGIFNAPKNGLESGCDVVQIFTKNQMQWKVKDLTDEDIIKFKTQVQQTGVKVVCVHASYLINLGGFDPYKLQRSRKNFAIEMERAEALGIPFLVVHPGSHVGKGEAEGLRRISESLNVVFEKCPDLKLKVLLETTAGQGDNLGFTFEQLAQMKAKVDAEERIGFCLDTCHLFAAGYELRNDAGYKETMRQLASTIGIDHVGIIHANDSQKSLGSRIDRHAHIGDGELGLAAFAYLVNDTRFNNVPFIIETPGGTVKDVENLQLLRNLVKT